MDRESVSSTNLVSVGYDSDSELLEVEFKKGEVYQYFNVPEFIHERLMAADSIGRFFNIEIKDSFSCQKL